MKSLFSYFVIILLVGSLSIINCQVNDNYGIILGTITDSVSSEPIVAALVSFIDSDLSDKLGTITNEDGKYQISKVPYGIYTIKLSALGWLSKIIDSVHVGSGDTIRIDRVLRDYAYYGEDVAKEELSKGIANIWLGGLIVRVQKATPDSVIEAVHKKYGFEYVLIGCDPTGANEHNAVVEEYLEKRNGKGWQQKMEEELSKLEDYYKSIK